MVDKKKIIHAAYLALGSIALYISIGSFGSTIYVWTEYSGDLKYVINFMLTLIAGMLLIVTYHGFLHAKMYSRFTGIGGCIFLVGYHGYNWMDFIESMEISPVLIFTKIPWLSTLITSFILLIVTLIFWKKLE